MADISQQITEIGNKITQLENEYNSTTDEKKQKYLLQQIETHKQQRNQLRQQMRNYVQSRTGRRSKSQQNPPQQQQSSTAPDMNPSTSPETPSSPTNQESKDLSPQEYEDLARQARNGELKQLGIQTQEDLDRYLESQGRKFKQTNSDYQANVPLWRTRTGEPARFPTGQRLTNEFYEKVVRDAESGRHPNFHTRADVDRYYEGFGFVKGTEPKKQSSMAQLQSNIDWRPSYQKGFSNPLAIPPSTETSLTWNLTEEEKKQADEFLENPDAIKNSPVNSEIQASNPNTLNRSGMQLASMSTPNNPFPDAPEGSYTLRERISDVADDTYDAMSEKFYRDPDVFTEGSGDVQPPFNPDGRYTTREAVQQDSEYLRNPEVWQGIVDSANQERRNSISGDNPDYENLANRRTPRQNATARQINRRAARFEPIISSTARKYGVDPNLIKAIIMTESAFNPNARSDVGAQGLMQLMPPTARSLGVRNSLDPAQNIEGGTKYIAQMLRMFKGDVRKALWAYNAGPGNAKKGRLPDETKAYIPRVMRFYNALRGVPQTSTRRTPVRRNSRTRLANNPSVTPTEQSSLNNLNGYRRASDTNTQMQDNSPIAWQNANGQAALTQNMYEELVSRAERGEIDGFISREDVDEYLSKTRGLRNVAQTPAPEYTDAVNQTMAADTQNLLNELNGLTDENSSFGAAFLRRFSPYSLA